MNGLRVHEYGVNGVEGLDAQPEEVMHAVLDASMSPAMHACYGDR